MFDPLLRVLKGSQLLLISIVFSLSFPINALADDLTQQGEQKVAQTNDAEITINAEPELEPLDEQVLDTGVGPKLTEQIEDAPLAIEKTNDQPFEQPTSLGPLIKPTTSHRTAQPSLPPRLPVLNFESNKREESLEHLWQKTFPSLPQTKPIKDAYTETEKAFPVLDDVNQEEQAVIKEDTRPTITIIIDDLGYNRRGMEESLALPVEVTLAILPHTPFSKKTALAATEQERTIMLHVPMENERELKLGPGGLYRTMGEHELKKSLKESIESVPGIAGINNHMGSLLTQDVEKMKWVMEVIEPMDLFFVDSLTSPNSVALANANKFNLTTTIRDVFLDNVQNEKAIDRQFKRLLTIARKRGKALAIGHPYPSTMSYLSKRLAKLEKDGVRLVSISDYVK